MSSVQSCPACGLEVPIPEHGVARYVTCPHCAERVRLDGGEGPVALSAPSSFAYNRAALRFTFACQRCGCILEASGDLAGQHGRCPTCGAVFTIPAVDPRTGLALGPAKVGDDGQLPTPMHAYATAGTRAPRIRRLENGQQAIVCPRCGRDMPVDADTCTACGLPFTMEGAAEVGHASYSSSSMATASLVTGVLALPSFCFPALGVVAIVLGIVALMRGGGKEQAERGRGTAWAGICLGALSLLLFGGRLAMGKLF